MARNPRRTRRLCPEQLETRQLLHGGGFGPQAEPPTIEERVESAFERLDANSDELLTEDEVSARAWERLSAADTDDVEGVSAAELTEFLENAPVERPNHGGGRGFGRGGDHGIPHGHRGRGESLTVEERVDNLFASNDANGDELLTEDEVSVRQWDRIAEADVEGDGDGVSMQELLDYIDLKMAEKIADAFSRLDADGSGEIEEGEVSDRFWTRVSEADGEDEGNSVSLEEFEAHIEARRAGDEVDDGEAGEETDDAITEAAASATVQPRLAAMGAARAAARARLRR